MLLFVFSVATLIFLVLTVLDWENTLFGSDIMTPLNVALFCPPVSGYDRQIVTHEIPKPWRKNNSFGQASTIPAMLIEGNVKGIILYCHGSRETIADCGYFCKELSRATGLSVLTWDPSGFGANPPNRYERSAEGMNMTLVAVLEYALNELFFVSDRVYLMGFSVGSGPVCAAVNMLSRDKYRGCILLNPFSSVKQIVRDHTVGSIHDWCEERWDNVELLRTANNPGTPVLVIAAESDTMFPPATHAALLDKNYERIGGTHTKFSWKAVGARVSKWIADMTTAATPAEDMYTVD